jgi:putative SOS response-associated peptidase YedK
MANSQTALPTDVAGLSTKYTSKPVNLLNIQIPSWAKDTSSAARMINARSETAQTLPAFRHPMKLRSCLIPADGFYYSVLKKTLGGETHS